MVIGIKESSVTKVWNDVTWDQSTGKIEIRYSAETVVIGNALNREDAVDLAKAYCSLMGEKFKRKFW